MQEISFKTINPQLLKPSLYLFLHRTKLTEDFRRRRVLDRHVLDFLILIDGEIIVIGSDFFLRDEEALLGALALCLRVLMMEAEDEVRDIILFHRISLIIEGEAVGFHVIKPHLVRPAGIGLGEDENGSGDAGIGFEDAGGHGNHSLELVMLDKFFADGFVRFAAAEEDAVGDDAGAAATLLQRAEEEGEEEELCLLRIRHGLQLFVNAFSIDASFEGRIRKAQCVGTLGLVLLREAVLIGDAGMDDAMEHEIHRGDAEHRLVGVESMKHRFLIMRPVAIGHRVSVVRRNVLRG